LLPPDDLHATHPDHDPAASREPSEAGARSRIGILEQNRTVAGRAARVLRSASGLAEVAIADDPASLRTMLADDPSLLACDAADLDLAAEWTTSRYRDLSVVTWTSGSMDGLLELALRYPRIVALVGWPSFASMPRSWELALAARRITHPGMGAPRLSEMVPWGSTVVKFRPRTSHDRDVVVAEVATLAERAGAANRLAQRVGEVAHEMLMNAMYDAPVDAHGDPLYAHDRKQDIQLQDDHAPTFRFAADGVHVALQVVDRFGGLEREHVLRGILRGRAGGSGDAGVIDTSGGGAGLGLYRIYTRSTIMIVDVDPRHYTSVTAFFDMDVNPREARSLPVSLHLYRSTQS